jgi:hypothetical protein
MSSRNGKIQARPVMRDGTLEHANFTPDGFNAAPSGNDDTRQLSAS